MPADLPPVSGRNPWWIPPFLLGRVPADVEPRLVTLLGFVGFALFFENYDYSLLNAALPHIKRDLAIPEHDLPYFTSWIRFGALPAFVLLPLADRIGRRRLFLIGVTGLSLGSFFTAFSQSPAQFVFFQAVTRACMLTTAVVSFVMVTEEFPAAHRGWGIGILAAVAAVGYGFGAALFAAIDWLPHGWRALYAFGITPILLLPRFRRGIRETRRFQRLRDQREVEGGAAPLVSGWLQPLAGLARSHPLRVAGVALMASVAAAGHSVVLQYIGYFVQESRGWQPFQFSMMVILCGGLAVPSNVIAGRLADRVGRRAVGFIFLSMFPVCGWLFFQGPNWLLPAVWVVMVFFLMGGNVIIRLLSTELFPTSHRGTSAGLIALMETLGAALGLGVLGLIADARGDLISSVPLVAAATAVSAFILLLLPETRSRELELISHEQPATHRRAPVETASGVVEA